MILRFLIRGLLLHVKDVLSLTYTYCNYAKALKCCNTLLYVLAATPSQTNLKDERKMMRKMGTADMSEGQIFETAK